MKSRFFLIISIALFVFSCDHFVNLGDDDISSADNTEGLPDEIYDGDYTDSAGAENYDDWNEDSANTEYYEEDDSDAAQESSDQADTEAPDEADTNSETDYEDFDIEKSDETPDEDEGTYIFPESGDPFLGGFANTECNCGETPQYQPLCCDGKISVFNVCFANCYAVNSGNKICYSHKTGRCNGSEENGTGSEENDQDIEIIDDSDKELPDSDEDTSIIDNECGCYPEEEAGIFKCGEDSYAITSCLANCICDDPQKISF